MSETPLLDADVTARLERELGQDVVEEVIELFLEHGPKRAEDLRSARRADDLGASAEALHSIKSSAGNLGAARLQELSEQAEQLARAGDARQFEAAMRRFEQVFEQTLALLGRRRGGSSDGTSGVDRGHRD